MYKGGEKKSFEMYVNETDTGMLHAVFFAGITHLSDRENLIDINWYSVAGRDIKVISYTAKLSERIALQMIETWLRGETEVTRL